MATVMPGTVIKFGAEYRRRPVLSLFGSSKDYKDYTLSIPDTHIKVQASIAITREFPDQNETLILRDINDNQDGREDFRGQIVNIIT